MTLLWDQIPLKILNQLKFKLTSTTDTLMKVNLVS
jgi:hypothetical protein